MPHLITIINILEILQD